MRIAAVSLLAALLLTAGCARTNPSPPPVAANEATADAAVKPVPATHPTDDPAYFTLEEILPIPQLPHPKKSATTAPAAPLDALQWFAQARAANARGDRNTAINLL